MTIEHAIIIYIPTFLGLVVYLFRVMEIGKSKNPFHSILLVAGALLIAAVGAIPMTATITGVIFGVGGW